MDIKKIGLLAIILAIFAIVLASEGAISSFTANISGQPAINTSVTLIAGGNITLSQDTAAKTITINATGGGGIGSETDPIAMANISGNQIAWNTTNWSYVNDTFLKLSGGTMTGSINMNDTVLSNASEYITHRRPSVNFTINRTYTGTANDIASFGQSSSVIKFLVTGNDLTGGYNFRVNMNPDQSQQDKTKAGWGLVLKPYDAMQGSRFQINRAVPNSTTLEAIVDIWSNDSIYLGYVFSNNTKVVITNLSGSGNALVYVDSSGVLKRDDIGYISGSGYMCYNSTALWYFKTTACDS